jgi:hypothetical protein
MSAARTGRRLLRLYPPAWRARYGDELEDLIVESSTGDRVPWRTRLDVVLAAGRERRRAAGLSGDAAPGDRVRGGALLVFVAWALLVLGGAGVQKFSEHWQAATPPGDRTVPGLAFGVLVVAAVCGGVLVVAGAAGAAPGLPAFLRGGGWAQVRRHVLAAAVTTGVAAVATVGLVGWAGRLTPHERTGSDPAYSVAFVVWAVLVAAGLLAWTAAGVAVARRVSWPDALLRVEAWIALAVTVAMVVTTVATAVWWWALADAAPWFLAGRPVGDRGQAVPPQLAALVATMALASLLAAAGSRQALLGLTAPSRHQPKPAAGSSS